MQDLEIVIVQADQKWEDKIGNFENYTKLLKEVSSCDLIVFPEMFHTGFTMNVEEMYETMENSIGIDWLKNLAQEKNSAIYTSLIIKDSSKFHNRGIFIYANGSIEFYDKRKSFGLAGEDQFFTAGNKSKIIEYKDWKIQLQICYDLRFPEIARNKIESNQLPSYDVLIYIANWPEKRSVHWTTLLKARAIENQCFVVGANRVGKDGKNLQYSGNSMIINALGEEDTSLPSQESILKVKLNKEMLNNIRHDLPFLKD
ncbi:MAG: nitrilase family protein [Flavobacteriia bacterium]|nr:nitrilase family protein [Flavobacteriia bacterium]